jgi:hypothetical protein
MMIAYTEAGKKVVDLTLVKPKDNNKGKYYEGRLDGHYMIRRWSESGRLSFGNKHCPHDLALWSIERG